jgi:outer membrane protein assembly factor BamE (lipoprotein component of BamABCDE complex)
MFMKRINVILLCALIMGGCAMQERRSEMIRSQHPEWDQATVSKLAARTVEAGMTREMVKAALGSPDSLSRDGEEEVWGYAYWLASGESSRKVFVYFVHFKGDRVVRTNGDVTRLMTLS